MSDDQIIVIPDPTPGGIIVVDDEAPDSIIIIEESGPPGGRGEKGDKGDKGDPGIPAEVSVVSTTTVPPSSAADVLDTDPSLNKTALAFYIPKGDKGDKGDPSTVPGPAGPAGPAGVNNAVYTAQWRWTTKTTDAATAGQVGNNDPTNQWAATLLNINEQKDDNTSVAAHLALIKVGDRLRVQQKTDGTKWGDYEVTGAGVDRGTYWEFPVLLLAASPTEPGNNAETIVSHIVDGDAQYVNKGGDTMTGDLDINNAAPGGLLHTGGVWGGTYTGVQRRGSGTANSGLLLGSATDPNVYLVSEGTVILRPSMDGLSQVEFSATGVIFPKSIQVQGMKVGDRSEWAGWDAVENGVAALNFASPGMGGDILLHTLVAGGKVYLRPNGDDTSAQIVVDGLQLLLPRNGSLGLHAATVQQMAAADALAFPKTGGTISGSVTIQGALVTSGSNTVTGNNAGILFPGTTSGVYWSNSDAYLYNAGVGDIRLTNAAKNTYRTLGVADPQQPTHAATRAYVDAADAYKADKYLAQGDGWQRIAVPSYFYPTYYNPPGGNHDWERMIAAAPFSSIALINPANGPGSSVNADYDITIKRARAGGTRTLGYVRTDYTAVPIATVKADIDKYYNWYPVDGIFLDEGTYETNSTYLTYYTDLYNYIKAKHPQRNFVVLNPGVTGIDEGYMACCDVVMNFESSASIYSSATWPSWTLNYGAHRFWHCIYGLTSVDQIQTVLAKTRENRAGYVYLTDDVLDPNPYDRLPSQAYWDALVSAVRTGPLSGGGGLDQATADIRYVNIAGDQMEGSLAISTPAAQVAATGFMTGGALRWNLGKEGTPEAGANTGGNFVIAAFDDSGNWLFSPVTIMRNSGEVWINRDLVLANNPTYPSHAVRKDYVDSRTPKITVSATAPSTPAVGDVWIDTSEM